MENNKLLQTLLDDATKICIEHRSKYLLIEHVLLALIQMKKFKDVLMMKDSKPIRILFREVRKTVKEYLTNFELIETVTEEDYTPIISEHIKDYIAFITLMKKVQAELLTYTDTIEYLTLLDGILCVVGTQAENILVSHGITHAFLGGLVSETTFTDIIKEDISSYMDTSSFNKSAPINENNFLTQYCIDISEKVKAEEWCPMVGREEEVDMLKQIILRKDKPNAILVGHEGIGKTKLIEGFAKALNDIKSEHKILQLDMLEFTSDIGVKGKIERRVKTLLSILADNPNVILFVDEIHTICGSAESSNVEIAEMIKPLLTNGNIRLIGATTFDEYRKYIERNESFARRFHKMVIQEPAESETLTILNNIKPYYERHFGVSYPKTSINEIIKLTKKYLHTRYFPEKAIDLLDMVGAKCKHINKKTASVEEVQKTFSLMSDIPLHKISQEESTLYKTLESKLTERIIGQEEAVTKVSDSIIISKSGLREGNKTAVSLMFTGASGVGKTEICKSLSDIMSIPLVRFDMSEFMEEHSVSKLLGAPPGYKGFNDGKSGGGLLINSIDENPNCILLLDEIEKANSKILNILLQVMDNGKLTSSNGKTVSFDNVFLIMTSNVGSYNAHKKGIGFNNSSNPSEKDFENSFLPEFRNRIDATIKFNNLSEEVLNDICKKFLKEFNDILLDRKLSIKYDEEVISYIVKNVINQNSGARPMKHIITNEIKNIIAKNIVMGVYKDKDVININVKDNVLVVGEN